ncbi:hypothetical protein HHI36_010626 [Cryptolaemus montrouzieri]|uniref:Seryl-tRNA synthetase n=1 Tax=Cryptolaemus montrouzieri TaxID=559131 RepID=A0ABD2MJ89_9CUCU
MKSALYVVGDKAQHMFVAVQPFIDFEKRLKDKDELERNITRRCTSIDLQKIEKRYYFYKTLEEKKEILEQTKYEINNLYEMVIKETNSDINKINQLKLHKHVVTEELKSLKEYLYSLEENVMISILGLPNDIHELTPEEDQIIHEFMEKPSHRSESHMKIGLNIIKLVENWGCYLRSDASLFELAISNYFQRSLIRSDFIQFQNADFTRSVVVEGCGTDVVNNKEVVTIYEPNTKNEVVEELSRLHLTGSASMYAFMAYFAKNLVYRSQFPLKYFCYGRSYKGLRSNKNLFDLTQESALNVFVASVDDVWVHFKHLTDDIIQIYNNLGYHYRLVYLQPSKLNKSESLRLSIQMFSNHQQEYVEVGNLSLYDTYISERLLFSCLGKEQIFPKLIGVIS